MMTSGAGLWLAIDAGRAGWLPGQDLGPYLKRALALFAGKPWAGGQLPEVIKAHPADAANGAGTAAAALGLVVVPDPRVGRGVIYLGLKGGGKGEMA